MLYKRQADSRFLDHVTFIDQAMTLEAILLILRARLSNAV